MKLIKGNRFICFLRVGQNVGKIGDETFMDSSLKEVEVLNEFFAYRGTREEFPELGARVFDGCDIRKYAPDLLPEELKDDPEKAKEMILKDYGFLDYDFGYLNFFGEKVRSNKEAALLAVKDNFFNIRYVDDRFLHDREFMLEALCSLDPRDCQPYYCGNGLIAEEFQNDKAIVFLALLHEQMEFEEVGEQLKKDKEIAKHQSEEGRYQTSMQLLDILSGNEEIDDDSMFSV